MYELRRQLKLPFFFQTQNHSELLAYDGPLHENHNLILLINFQPLRL